MGNASAQASVWACSSARGSSRRTGAASGPRAAARAAARGSPSRCRWPTRRATAARPARRRTAPERRGRGAGKCASWWSTTTRRRCATSGTRWSGRLRPGRHRRPAGAARPRQVAQAAPGAAGPAPAGDRRHRADAARPRAGRPAGHLYTPRTAATRCSSALDAGAADYIVKPYSPTKLTVRVGAALRRRAEPEPFRLGELAIRYDERRVMLAGRPLELTLTEYELLLVLSLNAGRAVAFPPWSVKPGAGGMPIRQTRNWCAPSCEGSAASWVTTRPGPTTSSTSAGSATGCLDPSIHEGREVPRQRGGTMILCHTESHPAAGSRHRNAPRLRSHRVPQQERAATRGPRSRHPPCREPGYAGQHNRDRTRLAVADPGTHNRPRRRAGRPTHGAPLAQAGNPTSALGRARPKGGAGCLNEHIRICAGGAG